ncbi:MAG: adenylate/guanylate cyclase domain-containing protein [Candidatus Gastranaerophilales bacterium]|nr:adenylate/guanylate cyclase domain-containing protein [Candidatus Gastranaerophilales bacterium]
MSFVFSKFFAGLETFSQDWKQTLELNFSKHNDYNNVREKIVILSIDDLTSFDLSNHPEVNIKRWPLGRDMWGEIIDFLEKGKPATISIAIPFQNYEDITHSASSSDLKLADTLEKYDNVILGTILNTPQTVTKDSPMTVLMDKIDNSYVPLRESLNVNFVSDREFGDDVNYFSYLAIPPIFVDSSSIGYMNLQREYDSVIRYSQPISRIIDKSIVYYMPSFPFATFLKYIGYEGRLNIDKTKMSFKNYSIPLNKGADNYVNWNGMSRYYNFIPLSKIIIGMKTTGRSFEYEKIKYPVEYFKGKIVIIAPTQTNSNTHDTAIYQGLTDAEVYANIIQNYINDAQLDNPVRTKFLREMPAAMTIAIVLFFVLLIVLNALYSKISLLTFFNSILIILLYLFLDLFLFSHPKIRLDMPLVHPLYLLSITLFCSYLYVLIDENTKKKEIVGIFGKFVADNVLDRLLKNSRNFELKTAHKNVSVMFCDVTNFTSINEKYSVDLVVEKLNEVFTIATEKIFKYQGTIDKFIGDAVMAYWGDPISDPKDAMNAVKAAVEIIEAIDDFNKSLPEKELKLDVKIAINTGEALVGCIGTDKIVDYTVLGDTVNIASRMTEICSEFNKKLLISEATYEAVKNIIQADYTGNIKLKGKDIQVALYAPKMGEDDD